VNVIDDPAVCGAGRSAEIDVSVSTPDDGAVGAGLWVEELAPEIGKAMLPADWLLSYKSADDVALRTQTETRYPELATVGVHVHVLSVDQLRVTYQPTAPSYTHHLNCCGAVPPATVAVNVIDDPAGCGAGRFAARDVRVNAPPVGADVDGAVPPGATIDHVNVWIDDSDSSRAVIVTLYVPIVVGVPAMKPVDDCSDSPGGRPAAE